MKVNYYFNNGDKNVRLRVDVSARFEGAKCLEYSIEGITVIAMAHMGDWGADRSKHQHIVLSNQEKVYRDLESGLYQDVGFTCAIEQKHLDDDIDLALSLEDGL